MEPSPPQGPHLPRGSPPRTQAQEALLRCGGSSPIALGVLPWASFSAAFPSTAFSLSSTASFAFRLSFSAVATGSWSGTAPPVGSPAPRRLSGGLVYLPGVPSSSQENFWGCYASVANWHHFQMLSIVPVVRESGRLYGHKPACQSVSDFCQTSGLEKIQTSRQSLQLPQVPDLAAHLWTSNYLKVR